MSHRLTRPALAALPLLLTALVAAGCGDETSGSTSPNDAAASAGDYPVTVASCGERYRYTRPPQRVVVGSPTTVDTLAALGVAGRAVGYTNGDTGPAPSASVPEISGAYTAPRERILAVRPDFLLANAGDQVSGNDGTVSVVDLRQAGANAYVLGDYCQNRPGATDVQAVYDDLHNLGAIFGVPARADALIRRLKARVARAANRRGDRPRPTVAFVQLYDGKLYALSGANAAAALTAVGARNAFAGLKENFAQITPERVLTLKADAIAFVYPFDGRLAQARADLVKLLAGSAAVRDGRLVGIPSNLSEAAGVAVFDIVDRLAAGLYR